MDNGPWTIEILPTPGVFLPRPLTPKSHGLKRRGNLAKRQKTTSGRNVCSPWNIFQKPEEK
jgi:hypothetical protein